MCDDNECAPIKPSPITPEPLPNPDKKDAIVVNELPEKGEPNAVYWLMKEGSDAYDLYQWVSDGWRKIDIDISLYGNTGNNTDGAMTQKATTQALGGKQDILIAGDNIHIAADGKTISADGMVVLSYGNSTWDDFITAYNANRVVYCRASSETNPALGSQGRLAFMAFITNPTNPTAVEFQYFRSVTKKDATQQCDQIFVYKLTSADKWTVEIRNVASKIVAGTGLSSTYDNGEITLNATGGGSSSITYHVNDWLPDDRTQLDGKDVYKDAECTTSLTGGEFFDDVNSGKPIRIVFDNGSYPIETTFLYGFSMPRDKEETSFDNWNPQGHFDFLGRRFTIMFQHYQASATGCWSVYVDEPA